MGATPARFRTGSLVQIDPAGQRLTFHIDPEAADRQGGTGGWDVIDRPRLVQATRWAGQPAHTMELELIFGTEMTLSVEKDCALLDQMGKPVKPGVAPPVIQIALHNYSRMKWVIQDIQWHDQFWVRGERVRAGATVSFLQYHPLAISKTLTESIKQGIGGNGPTNSSGNTVGGSADNGQNNGPTPPAPRPAKYTVRAGDTVAKIAARYGTTVGTLSALNGYDKKTPMIVRTGDIILVPGRVSPNVGGGA